ncbi:hypothetical protein [Pseudodonghicola xiamenensis]|uniref:Uncharacterized protein n=1 Tax=Pseudodonghicola xiamenensis TaxID=337702 RepID=A0A8J3H628_9RHOB|nr:hypothetical protein [Pseudodonghicola xiamenensis]GHG91411.1 hypothetical protein GCM10010961_22630 [Pseudodonghicola xiamenensis]
MTALREYERLEASGLWRRSLEDQRREVIVSVGEATLTISDMADRALTHWSLAAVVRYNPGVLPAIYHPDGDPDETLELADGEDAMIEAIERIRTAISRSRPRPGRLRLASVSASLAAVLVLLVFWLPGALQRHATQVVPDIKRQEIGQTLLRRIERVTGKACETPEGLTILNRLARRTGTGRLVVLRTGVQTTLHLPGDIILLNRDLIENYEDPAVAAGFILAEQSRATENDPLADLLRYGGPVASFRLLTTGEVSHDTLDSYAEHVLTAGRPSQDPTILLKAFDEAQVPTSPYALTLDPSGETVQELIDADPMAGKDGDPVLPDRDWVILQGICGG